MIGLVLAGALSLLPPVATTSKPAEKTIVQLPRVDNELNIMFVASKGNRKYKILTFPQIEKEMDKCIMLHVEMYDTPDGPLIVFRCEESQ